VERARVEVALVYDDGRKLVADISRPAALVWFGDEYGKLQPETYSEIARLVHHVEAPDTPFAEWIETVEVLDAQDETIEQVRAALAAENGHPTPPTTAAPKTLVGEIGEGT
jgi:hypothetical protein